MDINHGQGTDSVFLPTLLVICFIIKIGWLSIKVSRGNNKKDVFWDRVSNVNSKLSRNNAESSYDWLGDLWKPNYIVCHLFINQKLCFREEIWYQGPLMVGIFYNTYIHLHVKYQLDAQPKHYIAGYVQVAIIKREKTIVLHPKIPTLNDKKSIDIVVNML